MKKVVSFLAVLAVVAIAGTFVFADEEKGIKSALAEFGDAPELSIAVTVHSFGDAVSDYTTVAEKTGDRKDVIEFNVPDDFVLVSTTAQRVVGKDFLKVHSNIAQQPSGCIVMMSSNAASTTYQAKSTRYEDWGGTYANLKNGLVRVGSTSDYQEGDFAPITTLTVSVSSANANFSSAYPTATQFETFTSWQGRRALPDFGDVLTGAVTQYANFEKYIGLSNNGLWISGGRPSADTESSAYTLEDVIIFFSASFTKVKANSTYGTDQIKFVATAE